MRHSFTPYVELAASRSVSIQVFRFQALWLSKKGMIFWRDLLNFETRDWMDWRLIAHQKFLSSNKLAIKPIMGLNPPEKEYKLNTDMQAPLWQDWGWRFEKQLQLYDRKKIYSLLHQKRLYLLCWMLDGLVLIQSIGGYVNCIVFSHSALVTSSGFLFDWMFTRGFHPKPTLLK